MTDEQLDIHLDNILKASGSALKHYSMQKTKDDMRQALRQAIAELESQEPDVVRLSNGTFDVIGSKIVPLGALLYLHPPQRTEQNFCPRCGKRTNDIHTCTPPQRTWVGLTEAEMYKLWLGADEENDRMAFGKAIEAKLKEKNT